MIIDRRPNGEAVETGCIGSSVPISLAITAGGLAVVNPCSFPLLPAFLSYYAAADEEHLPTAPSRAVQGLMVGVLVSAGFLGVFVRVCASAR